jgi:hypothetical protein
MRGPLPASLGALTALTRLCVPRRAAAAPAPRWRSSRLACRLPRLLTHVRAACAPRRSDLSHNVLTGALPAALGALTALTALCVRLRRRAARMRMCPCQTLALMGPARNRTRAR